MSTAKDSGLLPGASHTTVPQVADFGHELSFVTSRDDMVGYLSGSVPRKGMLVKIQPEVVVDRLGGKVPWSGGSGLRDSSEKNEKREKRKKGKVK